MKSFLHAFLATLLGILFLGITSGCSVIPEKTASAEKASYHYGGWIWNDLVCNDPELAAAFYSRVFNWKLTDAVEPGKTYLKASYNNIPVAGIVRFSHQNGSERNARWVSHLSVASVEDASRLVTDNNGKIIIPKQHLAERGDTAVVKDSEGALFGLLHSNSGDELTETAQLNTFIWHELWAKDLAAMSRFYTSLADYSVEEHKTPDDFDEVRLVKNGTALAGIIQIENPEIDSAWLPYILVSDLQTTITRVKENGGQVALAPSANIRNGRVAIIRDNQGAALGLVENELKTGVSGK